MFAAEDTIVARRICIFTIELLIPLAVITKLDIGFLPSGFPITFIHNTVHSLIEFIHQVHRDLPVGER